MSKFKTITENGNLASGFGMLKMLSTGNKLVQEVELWLLNGKKTRNNWTYRNLEQHLTLFEDIPILVAYVNGKLGSQSGHNFREVHHPDGSVTASFLDADAEHIVGRLLSKNDVRIEDKDGTEWIVAKGQIWKWYAQELVAHLKEQGLDGQQISIETLIQETTYDEKGDEVFLKWLPIGVTILGMQEAVENAYIRALSALGVDKIREKTLRVASLYQEQKNKYPQTKTKKENQKTMRIKDLQNNFEGFKVCQVEGEKVALLSKDNGSAYVSTAVEDNGKIVEGVKTAVNATVVFGDGENQVSVALDQIIDAFNADIATLTAQLKECQESKEAVEKSLKTMQDTETARRKEAVKNAIKTRFDEIKAHSKCDFAENECDDLMTDEKIAKYSEMEENGKFIGEEAARCDVDAKCMSKIIEKDKIRQNATRSVFNWQEGVVANGEEDMPANDIDKSIANILK